MLVHSMSLSKPLSVNNRWGSAAVTGKGPCCPNAKEEDALMIMQEMTAVIADTPVSFDDRWRFVSPQEETRETRDTTDDIRSIENDFDNICGDLCPLSNEETTHWFMSEDVIRKLLEASKEHLGKDFSLDNEFLSDNRKFPSDIAMAVSDPDVPDCPLVFVSHGFEALTGYSPDAAVGRSCRFLQPSSTIINDAVNLSERNIMRSFCNEDQPIGVALTNLILNERSTGERFWNLLRMQHVVADGARYIFAVQTALDAFMPKQLNQSVTGSALENESIVSSLAEFTYALDNVRAGMREQDYMPIQELKGYYTCAINMLQIMPSFGTQFPALSCQGDIQCQGDLQYEIDSEVSVGSNFPTSQDDIAGQYDNPID